MRIVDYSDSEEVQYRRAQGFESSDEEAPQVDEHDDDDEPSPNQRAVDEEHDFLTSSGESDYDTADEDDERDPNEEDEIYDEHVEEIRQFVQPCRSLGCQGWATEFTFRTIEDDNRIEDIAELVNVVLRKLIRDVKRNAQVQGYRGGWIGVAWASEHMKNSFFIP